MEETRHPLNPRIRHETTDINVWAVGKFGIALVIVTIISLGLVFGLMMFFQSREESHVRDDHRAHQAVSAAPVATDSDAGSPRHPGRGR